MKYMYATKHGTIFDGGGNAVVVVFNFSSRHKNIGVKCLKAIIILKKTRVPNLNQLGQASLKSARTIDFIYGAIIFRT